MYLHLPVFITAISGTILVLNVYFAISTFVEVICLLIFPLEIKLNQKSLQISSNLIYIDYTIPM